MKNKETVVVNLFAGPGAGKSTSAAGMFYRLKMDGHDCELVREYAKDKTWESNFKAISNQLYLTAKQEYRQDILMGKVDVIITDSPILLGLFYYKEQDPIIRTAFETFVIHSFKRQKNINFFIERKKVYNPNGRNQTEAEAREIDQKTLDFLTKHEIPYTTVPGTPQGLEYMYDRITLEMEKFKNATP